MQDTYIFLAQPVIAQHRRDIRKELEAMQDRNPTAGSKRESSKRIETLFSKAVSHATKIRFSKAHDMSETVSSFDHAADFFFFPLLLPPCLPSYVAHASELAWSSGTRESCWIPNKPHATACFRELHRA